MKGRRSKRIVNPDFGVAYFAQGGILYKDSGEENNNIYLHVRYVPFGFRTDPNTFEPVFESRLMDVRLPKGSYSSSIEAIIEIKEDTFDNPRNFYDQCEKHGLGWVFPHSFYQQLLEGYQQFHYENKYLDGINDDLGLIPNVLDWYDFVWNTAGYHGTALETQAGIYDKVFKKFGKEAADKGITNDDFLCNLAKKAATIIEKDFKEIGALKALEKREVLKREE